MPSRSIKPKPDAELMASMLKNAADLFTEPLLLIDRTHRIILANNAAQKLTALEQTSLIGQQIETIFSLEDPISHLRITNINIPPNELLILPAKIHASPQTATFLPLSSIPYFKAFRPRATALAIVTPALSTHAQDHTTATIYLQILGQLTMRIAHDFSNSLTSIIANAELIEQQISALSAPGTPEPIKEIIDQTLPEIADVVRKSREMAEFINTLQEYARQEPTNGHTVDLNTAISETITMARTLLGRKIQVEFLPSDELPQIYMDRLRIDQIVLSILVHSKNAMPSGGRITIETETACLDQEFIMTHAGAREGNYTRLSITDSSAGMNPHALKHIFEFPLAKSTPNTVTLGLPTVYSILKQFRGYIDVESWLGKGTRFDIYLPQTPPDTISKEDDEEILVLHLPPRISQNSFKSSQTLTTTNTSLILVAEDDIDVQHSIERSCRRANYETLITINGSTTLERYRKLTAEANQPALLIADLGIPGIDGRTLCNTIKLEYPNAKFLLTSGYRIDLDPKTGKTEDGFEFLQKPFDSTVLSPKSKKSSQNPVPNPS